MEIDWTKESPKVKEACDLIVKAHNIHGSMTQEEKDRLSDLFDLVIPMEKIGD
jgi:cellobiose-specific phosphotransferase system component IIA